MDRTFCVVFVVLGLSLGNVAQDTAQCSSVNGVAQYKLSDDYGTCLLLNVTASVKIQNFSTEILTLPTQPQMECTNDSTCSNSAIRIGFNLTSSVCASCKLVFTFTLSNKQWGLAEVDFNGTVNIPGTQSPLYIAASNNSMRFLNAVNVTFRCTSPQVVSLSSNVSSIVVSVTTSNLRAQAFYFKEYDKFDAERVCVADLQGLLIVPVAVGSALAAIVFVLLVGYLVGRFVIHRRKLMYNKIS